MTIREIMQLKTLLVKASNTTRTMCMDDNISEDQFELLEEVESYADRAIESLTSLLKVTSKKPSWQDCD